MRWVGFFFCVCVRERSSLTALQDSVLLLASLLLRGDHLAEARHGEEGHGEEHVSDEVDRLVHLDRQGAAAESRSEKFLFCFVLSCEIRLIFFKAPVPIDTHRLAPPIRCQELFFFFVVFFSCDPTRL